MKKMGKVNSAKAIKSLTAIITGFGAVTSDRQHTYSLFTKFGELRLRIDCEPDSCVYTVFGMFMNLDKSRCDQIMALNNSIWNRLNPFSGKFNFHYNTLEELEMMIQDEFKLILGAK